MCLFLNSMCQVLVMADAANKFKREKLDPSIVKILRKNPKVKSVLVLNKVKCDLHFYSTVSRGLGAESMISGHGIRVT